MHAMVHTKLRLEAHTAVHWRYSFLISDDLVKMAIMVTHDLMCDVHDLMHC